ncbi:MAG TPA: FecR domain-containing protein [candidate division Zixibacteria bacterium]|jgi:ferric-dicitrate binding protein FerR (iron transport regulator)
MNEHNDYLWDKSGQPDPDIKRLEVLLGRFRYTPKTRPVPRRSAPVWIILPLAAAAALVIWIAGQSRPGANYSVQRLTGNAGEGFTQVSGHSAIRQGEWLETMEESVALIEIGDIGKVRLEPNSRLRVVNIGPKEHRLQLAHGTLHASIWAPPRLFFVETPSAVAVDLGCVYTLSVDSTGRGYVCVEFGEVALEWKGRAVVVPAGALCETRPQDGPGTPLWAGASDEFREILSKYDYAGNAAPILDTLLADAGTCEAFTLWRLLSEVGPEARSRIFDQLAEFAPPPEEVTRDGIVSLDSTMLNIWGYALERDEFIPCRQPCSQALFDNWKTVN